MLAWLLVPLAACGSDTEGSAPETTSRSESTAPPGDGSIRLTEVARFEQPLALVSRAGHDGVLYVAEREGRVRVLRDGEVDEEPLLDISGATAPEGEQGLLGLAFSPDGTFLYVSYTNLDGDSRLDEYAMGPGGTDIDLSSRREVLAVDQPFPNHNGGHILFGPDDLLYMGLGDGGGDSAGGDVMRNGQNPDTLLGKLLRIDPRPSRGAPYGTPPENPFVGGGGRSEIWVVGLRNPWRFSFDRETGDLWIGDVGAATLEEVSMLPAGAGGGANLGWSLFEGTHRFNEGDPPADLVSPIFEYGRGDGATVTGGFVYRGSRIPELVGSYVWGDFSTAVVEALTVDDGEVTGRRALGPVEAGRLVSFGEDADGELYVVSLSGPVYRVDPA